MGGQTVSCRKKEQGGKLQVKVKDVLSKKTIQTLWLLRLLREIIILLFFGGGEE